MPIFGSQVPTLPKRKGNKEKLFIYLFIKRNWENKRIKSSRKGSPSCVPNDTNLKDVGPSKCPRKASPDHSNLRTVRSHPPCDGGGSAPKSWEFARLDANYPKDSAGPKVLSRSKFTMRIMFAIAQ